MEKMMMLVDMLWVLLFIIANVAVLMIWAEKRRSSAGLPPGSVGLLPLVGETLQLVKAYKSDNPEPFIDSRVRRYGPVFTTHVFGEPTVFLTDAEANRFVLQNEGKLFESSYPSSIPSLLGRRSLMLMKGAQHKRMHSLIMSFANCSIIREHLLADIDRLVRSNLQSWPKTSRVRLQDQAKKITFDLLAKQLTSFDPGEWTESLRREYLLLVEGFFSVPLPFFFTTYGRALKARSKISEVLALVVRKRREETSRGEQRKDMLGMLLENEDQGGKGFTEEEAVDFMVALLVAGYETTSTIMTLAVKFLTETPPALVALREEHNAIRARKRDWEAALDWNDYKCSMPFTQCVVNETLRMANVIGGVIRRATSDVSIKGYTIPKGLRVCASLRAVHLDQGVYEDARTFNPWRWPISNATAANPVMNNSFMPFGGGPRLCPGYELARVETCVFLHHLVTCFSWTPAEDDKVAFFPTTRTIKGYPINVQRLDKNL